MKSKALLFVIGVCLFVVIVGITQRHFHQQPPPQPALHLDTTAETILAHADRVEVFRLADFHEGEFRTEADFAILDKQRLGTLDGYTILRVGKPQDQLFSTRLLAALSAAKDPVHSLTASCFDPGVGFRVWQGRAHVDAVVCFYCSGTEILTKDASGHEVWHTHAELGQARPALLALSRTAFPDDPILNGKQVAG